MGVRDLVRKGAGFPRQPYALAFTLGEMGATGVFESKSDGT